MSWEAIIDQMKEWVTDQAYATEAWVLAKVYATEAWVLGKGYISQANLLAWNVPLNVTGDLAPDATCSYFWAGVYNSKPYYRRNDGSYFIWWNGVTAWVISEDLGVAVQPLWIRISPDILGAYPPVPPTVGTATIADGYAYLKTSFVDRGDPLPTDLSLGLMIADNAWHDWDLSAIVPDGAKGVTVRIWGFVTLVNIFCRLRTKGNVNNKNEVYYNSVVALSIAAADGVCPVDPDRVIQYRIPAAGWVTLELTIKNWWY